MRKMSQYAHQYRKGHKARTKVITKYEGLPSYRTSSPLDPFDYDLSSKDEVNHHIMEIMNHVPISIEATKTNLSVNIFNDYQRVVKLMTNSKYFKFSPLQEQRLAFLMGSGYNKETGEMKIVCRNFERREDNTIRCLEILKELAIESMRAPFDTQN